uniref:Collagen, type VI, alpha 3 n=1 Tax=Mastacembelus armatus TaxID=205130 RepID=A0A7N8WTN7_9TELE
MIGHQLDHSKMCCTKFSASCACIDRVVMKKLRLLNMSQTLYFLAEKKPAGRDFVFLLDGSDATRSGFPAMRDFVQSVVQTLSVDDSKDRVSVVQYSREPAVQFYLNTYTTQGEILDSVRGLRHKGGRPLNTGAALQYLSDNVFTVSAGSRRLEGVPQVLILLSGGRSADNVDAQAAALKQLGVLTFAIGTRNSDSKELQKIAHSPTYALSVSEFNDLPSVRHLLKSTPDIFFMEITPESPTIPEFKNLARLMVSSQVYFKCSQLLFSCLFSVDTAKKDIVFLLDGSDGTRNGFPAMLDFVERVVEKLNVGENKDRVSVVQYSIDAEAHFYLNTYTTKDDIVGSVRGLRHRGGRAPNTGAALQYVRDNVLTSSAGSRHLQGVPQILILLNGGRSSDNVDTPASTLKQLGVLTFAIGTRGSDSAELQRLSSDPSHALSVSDFTDLPSVQEQLSSVMSRLNMSQTLYFLAEKKPAGRDFVFLLDGSDATRSGFPAMRDFVQSVVQALSVDDSKNRVSVVQYSREPAVQFYLNTYMTQGEILDSVRGLRHKGGRPLNTGAALQYLSDNVFTVSAGSRRLEGVPQVLILLSGGRSADNVDTPASALKQLGVLTFAIGTRGSDSAELQRLSSDPSHALSVSDFTDLPSVQEQLSSVMSRVLVRSTPRTPTVTGKKLNMSQTLYFLAEKKPAGRDFVFLLDGSDATRSGFPAMRDFVQSVVQTLSVDDSKDRVSVVQYSREPAVQFYLNTYTTQGEILDSVRGLRHRGGRPLNTGAALQYLSDNVFTVSAGSRRLEGVPQVLILLSGGRSADNVDAQAAALKQLGVLTFAIGTRNSDSKELQKIAHSPTYALSVSEFNDLPKQLSSVMMPVVPKKPAGRDFVFLLDGSDATRSGFPAMRDFVQSVVQTLSVDDSKDRVSVVQYSREPAVQFYLNTYTTQGEILDSVRGLRHRGGRPLNTGAALQYLSDNVFTVSAGSRRLEGVTQVLILLSGGRSADNVDAQAAALKQLGVLTFAIGTRNSDSKELQKIAHSPTYALSVSEFNDLPSSQLLFSCLFSVDTAKKDIVFLLDGSDGTRNGFPAMLDFVERVVEKLNVGENKDRVSVVQYSIDAEAHFYLNTYTTKDDIVGSVRGLRHRGGRAPNTGAALQYVRDNVLTSSAGSRHLQGVPQILILLNGGRSSDNVDTPASTLKQLGVLTFAIGTRGSDSAELQRLSSDPSHALSVSDFTDLPSVQEQLSSVMSRVLVRSTPRTPTVTGKKVTDFYIPKS